MDATKLAEALTEFFIEDGIEVERVDITTVPYLITTWEGGKQIVVQIYDMDGLGVPRDTSRRV